MGSYWIYELLSISIVSIYFPHSCCASTDDSPICLDPVANETISEWHRLQNLNCKVTYCVCRYGNVSVTQIVRSLIERSPAAFELCKPNPSLRRKVFVNLDHTFKEVTNFIISMNGQTESNNRFEFFYKSLNLSIESIQNEPASFKLFLDSLKNSELMSQLEDVTEIESENILDCSRYVNKTHMDLIMRRYNYFVTSDDVHWDNLLVDEINLRKCLNDHPIDILAHPLQSSNPFSLINVTVSIAPQCIISLNNEGELSLQALTVVSWQDFRRVWHAGNFPVPKKIRLHFYEIWHPIIWIDRCSGDACIIEPSNSTGITLIRTGDASYSLTKKIDVMCDPKFKKFPFDFQKCRIRFYSLDKYLHLSIHPFDYSTIPEFPREEWILYKNLTFETSLARVFTRVIGKDEYYSTLEYVYYFRRDPYYYLQNLIIPVITITVLGVFVVFLAPDSGDKLNFAIEILLGYVFLQSVIAEIMPKTGGMPTIGVYLIISLLLSAVNVGLITIMMKIYNLDSSNQPPFWAKFLVLEMMGFIVCSKHSICYRWLKQKVCTPSGRFRSRKNVVKCFRRIFHYFRRRNRNPQRASQIEEVALPVMGQRGSQMDAHENNEGSPISQQSPSPEVHDGVETSMERGNERSIEKEANIWQRIACVLDRFSSLLYLVASVLNFLINLVPLLNGKYEDDKTSP